jgi:hypothetical protein
MAARISCPRALEEGQSEEIVVRFRKSLRTRCAEFWTCCGQLLVGCRAFCLVLGVVILILFFFTYAFAWIPIIMEHCHREPGIELESFNILGMAPSSSSAPGSPLQVNSAFNATFSTWNTNTVTKCFTTYRRMDVRVEYRGQVLLQQQIPLGFSLKPRASRPFSIEMKGSHAQLMNPDLGPLMQAELQSGDITLDFFFNTRYLIADRRSQWESIGCVLVALLDPVGTMVPQDCFTFD